MRQKWRWGGGPHVREPCSLKQPGHFESLLWPTLRWAWPILKRERDDVSPSEINAKIGVEPLYACRRAPITRLHMPSAIPTMSEPAIDLGGHPVSEHTGARKGKDSTTLLSV